jgi:hypothetical protein
MMSPDRRVATSDFGHRNVLTSIGFVMNLLRILSVTCAAFALAQPVGAQEPQTAYLRWSVDIVDGLQAENGLTFDAFGEQSEVPVRVTFINEETDEALLVEPSFVDDVDVTWHHDRRAIPVSIQWRDAEVTTPDDIVIPVTLRTAITLEPGARLTLDGVIRKRGDDDSAFGLGEHRLTINLERAVRSLQSPAGTPWVGRYVESGDITVRVIEARTATDVRRKRLFDASKAMARDDANGALREYLQLIKQNPSDIAAHAGAGQAYMELRRFREAIAEFELVLPNYASERSLIPGWLAYSYLSVGEDQKAEALLVSTYGPEAGRRQLQQFRAGASRR